MLPGDVNIYQMTLVSPRGTVDLSTAFVSMKVYESIFVPNAILELNLVDTSDLQGTLNIVGDEMLSLSFGAPGATIANYTFAIDTVSDTQTLSSNKSKIYTLHGVGQEALQSKANYVQKAYNTDIASIVQDIHTTFLKSSKPLATESTQGTQNIVIPNKNPFEAIDMVRRRAVSSQNQSSTYLYWETWAGMNFKTIEGLFEQAPVKTFIRSDTVSANLMTSLDFNNIISYSVPQIASSTDRIAWGSLKQRVSTYNIRTKQYQFQDITPTQSSNSYNSPQFLALYGATFGKFSMIPQDTASRALTSIAQATPFQMSYVASLMQNQVNLRVPGDCIVKAGDITYLAIPQVIDQSGGVILDPQISGNFLVSRICRTVGMAQERPRFSDSIECISGSLAEGLGSGN